MGGGGITGIKLWDASTWGERYTIHQPGYALAFSPDDKLMATGAEDKTVTVFDTATGQSVQRLTGLSGKIRSVAFSPDGRLIASSAWVESSSGIRALGMKCKPSPTSHRRVRSVQT